MESEYEYFDKAKRLASETYLGGISDDDPIYIEPSEMYVVWFCKTLQNWKALVSTDKVKDHYFEITYNGDKKETYVDTYIKVNNEAVPDQ